MRDLRLSSDPENGSADTAGIVISHAEILAELNCILSSHDFAASERRRALLRFIVEETLAGRGNSLKGYTIALAVFGRQDSFDPQADPVVRLEARRLRRDLDSYYVGVGQQNPIRITIPKGSYIASFEWHACPPGRSEDPPQLNVAKRVKNGSRDRWKMLLAAAFAATLCLMLGGAWIWVAAPNPSIPPTREPGVLVMPFEPLSADENARYFALGVGQELVGNLFQFEGFRLFTLPASARAPSLAAGNSGLSPEITYVVTGNVQTNAEEVRVMAAVSNASTGAIVWTRTYSRFANPRSLMETQRQLASEIATVIGQPSGILRKDIGNSPSPGSMVSYTCVLRALGYQRTFSRALFDPVLQCLEETVQRDPEYSDAWAMLGWMRVHAGRNAYTGAENVQKEYTKALQDTSRAVSLQPNNPIALKALAATYHFLGRHDESDRISREVIQINPNDPDALGQFGWRLAVRGNFSEGVPMLKRAIERSVSPPGWYFHFIAVDLYMKGEYQHMLNVAEQAALSDTGFSQLLIAIANAELGRPRDSKIALEKMSRHESLARDPTGFLARNGVAEKLVDALVDGLSKARLLSPG